MESLWLSAQCVSCNLETLSHPLSLALQVASCDLTAAALHVDVAQAGHDAQGRCTVHELYSTLGEVGGPSDKG